MYAQFSNLWQRGTPRGPKVRGVRNLKFKKAKIPLKSKACFLLHFLNVILKIQGVSWPLTGVPGGKYFYFAMNVFMSQYASLLLLIFNTSMMFFVKTYHHKYSCKCWELCMSWRETFHSIWNCSWNSISSFIDLSANNIIKWNKPRICIVQI